MSRFCQVDYVVMNLTGNKYTNVNQFFILIIIGVVTFLNLTPTERMHTKESVLMMYPDIQKGGFIYALV